MHWLISLQPRRSIAESATADCGLGEKYSGRRSKNLQLETIESAIKHLNYRDDDAYIRIVIAFIQQIPDLVFPGTERSNL